MFSLTSVELLVANVRNGAECKGLNSLITHDIKTIQQYCVTVTGSRILYSIRKNFTLTMQYRGKKFDSKMWNS